MGRAPNTKTQPPPSRVAPCPKRAVNAVFTVLYNRSDAAYERRDCKCHTGGTMKNFALIGAAGYIAPRHLRAIKDSGNNLLAAVDRTDNVGILDSFFPDAMFFTEFENFERQIDIFREAGTSLDYVSIASPNYLHDSHIRFALRAGADAICEKPLVLSARHGEQLMAIEAATGRRVYTILQLRLHPALIALRERVHAQIAADSSKHFEVDLTYLTSRGSWYLASWKGDNAKSGGIAANIGIHFFDMLCWLFGAPETIGVNLFARDAAAGTIRFGNAAVRWFLSVNANYLPEDVRQAGQRTYRSITIDGEAVEFSEGFTELHTESYRHALGGQGFGIADALTSIRMVEELTAMTPTGNTPGAHPFVARVLA